MTKNMNMNAILLIARREFRQIAALRSFWLTLLLVPVALALGPLLGEYLDDDEATRVVLVDRSGGATAAAIEARFALEQDRDTLSDLSRYVRRYELSAADPGAVWARHDRLFSDADVAQYRAAGGLPAALREIERVKAAETPEFEAPLASYEFLAPLAALVSATDEEVLQNRIDGLLEADSEDGGADLVLLIGADYPADPVIRLYADDNLRPSFLTTLQDVLTSDLRERMMQTQGLSPAAANAVQNAVPAIAISTPPPGGGARQAVLVRSIVPLAISYILMMSLLLSGSWMLQGSVEERSNKLIESLLACIKPEELMYGKLIGTLAIGLSMIAVWVVCAAIAVFATGGVVSEFIRPALAPLTSPGVIVAMIYFFVMGYIAISIIFLAIGALSDSMTDAQGYLMPLMFAIMLPIFVLLQSILADNTGVMVHALTWIPLWTPFAVLARLGTGIEAWEMIGSGIVLAGFVALEIVLLGRLFRNSLLAQGQKPTWRMIKDNLRRSPG